MGMSAKRSSNAHSKELLSECPKYGHFSVRFELQQGCDMEDSVKNKFFIHGICACAHLAQLCNA